MGINLNNLAGKTATTDVHFMGETAKVTYDPTYLTRETLATATSKSDDAFLTMLCRLIKRWDVTQGKKTVPLTTAGLSKVPLVFLRAVFKTIMADAGAGEQGGAETREEGKDSSAT